MWTDYTKSEDICTSDFLNRVEGYHLPVVMLRRKRRGRNAKKY